MRSVKDTISRAEAAVRALSPSFRAWLGEEVQGLVQACQVAQRENFSAEFRQLVYLSAHTLKGQASTLGQPEIAQLAASLCRLLSQWAPAKAYAELAAEHVAAIEAVYRDPPSDGAITRAPELVRELDRKTATLLDPVACD